MDSSGISAASGTRMKKWAAKRCSFGEQGVLVAVMSEVLKCVKSWE